MDAYVSGSLALLLALLLAVTAEANLEVITKINGNVIQGGKVNIVSDERVVLECLVLESEDDQLEVQWLFDHGEIVVPLKDVMSNNNTVIITNTPSSSVATIENFRSNHEGKYLCTVKNGTWQYLVTSERIHLNFVLKSNEELNNKSRITDEFNHTCIIPTVSNIEKTSLESEGGHLNLTISWIYDVDRTDEWCNFGSFAVRYASWGSVSEVPEDYDSSTARVRYEWQPWTTISSRERDARMFEVADIERHRYYIFQLAVPFKRSNNHEPWYGTSGAHHFTSKVFFFGDQKAPRILDFAFTELNVSVGNVVNLTCVAEGLPKPDIQWLFSIPGVMMDETPLSTTNIYTIEHANGANSGRYTCHAMNILIGVSENRVQSSLKAITLNVYDPYGEHPSGRCTSHTSVVCNSNSSVWAVSDYSLEQIEGTGVRLMNEIQLEEVGKGCQERIMDLYCKWVMPSCQNGVRRTVCRSSCDAVLMDCPRDLWQRARAIIKGSSNWDDCHDLDDSNTCLPLMKPPVEPSVSASPEDESYIGVVAAVCVLMVLCAVLLLVIWCYCKKVRLSLKSYMPHPLDVNHMDRPIDLRNVNENYQKWRLPSLSGKDIESIRKIDKDNIKCISEIGKGNFGQVFKAECTGLLPDEKCTLVAVKCLHDCEMEEALKAFVHEARIMAKFDHPNIVRLFGVSLCNSPYYLIFEYMPEGDLLDYLQLRAPSKMKRTLNPASYRSRTESQMSNEPAGLTLDDQLYISYQICKGMVYLANEDPPYVHRDLATRNCLVGEKMVVKIGDFGMSQHLYHQDYYRVEGKAALPVRWMPPESIVYGKFTTESDVWSFGVVMWEIFSFGMQPFFGRGNEEVCEAVRKGSVLECPDGCYDEIYSIMRHCWALQENARPAFSDLLAKLRDMIHRKSGSNLSLPQSNLYEDESDRSTVFDQELQTPPPVMKEISGSPSDYSDMEV